MKWKPGVMHIKVLLSHFLILFFVHFHKFRQPYKYCLVENVGTLWSGGGGVPYGGPMVDMVQIVRSPSCLEEVG